MSPPILQTARLILRPITLDDAPAIQKHFDNWNIIQHLTTTVPWPYPADGAVTHITETVLPTNAAGTSLSWAITQHGDDELIGTIDFTFADGGFGNRGFWLAEHLWGQGIMTEAVTAVQDHVFFELGVERITVLNAATNMASRRIKEKTGARFLAQIQVAHHTGNNLSDKWEVTRDHWTTLRDNER